MRATAKLTQNATGVRVRKSPIAIDKMTTTPLTTTSHPAKTSSEMPIIPIICSHRRKAIS